MQNISQEKLLELPLGVPPIAEQEAIGHFLSADKAKYTRSVNVLSTQIQRLREYRQSLITAAVTGQIDVANEAESETLAEQGKRNVLAELAEDCV